VAGVEKKWEVSTSERSLLEKDIKASQRPVSFFLLTVMTVAPEMAQEA
jgi:hypothetical protein